MRDMQLLHGTRGDSKKQPATSKRHAANPSDENDSERQPTTMGDSFSHVATL